MNSFLLVKKSTQFRALRTCPVADANNPTWFIVQNDSWISQGSVEWTVW